MKTRQVDALQSLFFFNKIVYDVAIHDEAERKYICFEHKLECTLFQNGRHVGILLFTCKLALVASFLNLKFKRIFSLKRGNKA